MISALGSCQSHWLNYAAGDKLDCERDKWERTDLVSASSDKSSLWHTTHMVLHTAPDSHSESETFMCLLLYAVCGSRVGCPLVPMLTGLVTAQLTRDELHMAFLPPSAPYHHRVIDKGRAAAPVRGPTAGPVRGYLYTARSGEAASNSCPCRTQLPRVRRLYAACCPYAVA